MNINVQKINSAHESKQQQQIVILNDGIPFRLASKKKKEKKETLAVYI